MEALNLTTLIKKSTVKEVGKEWMEGICVSSTIPEIENKRIMYLKNYEKPVNTEEGECFKIPSYIIGGYHV